MPNPTITVDRLGLLRDGRRWLAVAGEIHYARLPADEWRDALRAMKAGGIEIVATYVFWIHHEPTRGTLDWTERRDLRRFIEIVRDVGLAAIVRVGPWCHGEVRNGGFPEWILPMGGALRSDDTAYLAEARRWYGEIARQLRGLLWRDGGPVIGVQIENEYHGPAEHLLSLLTIANGVGLDAPLMTRTGWPALTTPMPPGRLLPLQGAYAEGFWDRNTDAMPGRYWEAFTFRPIAADRAIATDHFGDGSNVEITDDPALTCELGGGMMSSYHRRLRIDPRDVLATALVKLGSGGAMLGYYMFRGGTNPGLGLNECQASAFTNHNDLPELGYDFQAPLGEFGQVRPHFHLLRRMHLMLRDFGESLAAMPPVFPTARPAGATDDATLRWCTRTDGTAAFVFVNNYQRGLPMPAKTNVRFDVPLATPLSIPDTPITVPADSSFVWPVNLDLAGVRLRYATAQPVCREGTTFYFAETPGVPAEFAFEGDRVLASLGTPIERRTRDGGVVRIVLVDASTPSDEVATPIVPNVELVRAADAPREIRNGKAGVAEAPASFDDAAVWQIRLPTDLDPTRDLLLRVRYVGDVARFELDGLPLTDQFYNGDAFELGLRRFAPSILTGELLLKILPLRVDTPILLPTSVAREGCAVASVKVIERR